MTADELARVLHPRGPLGLPDTPEVCAARLAQLGDEVRAAKAAAPDDYLSPQRRNARRRAHARRAAGR